MTVCGVNAFSVYGPVPTGLATVSVPGSAMADQMCLGTTKVFSTICWRTNWLEVNFTTTWLVPWTATVSTGMALALSSLWSFRIWKL